MTGSSTFSELLARETKDWIDEEISKGNEAWNTRRPSTAFPTSIGTWSSMLHHSSMSI